MFRLLFIKLTIGFLAYSLYLPTLLAAQFVPKKKRARFWRKMAIRVVKVSMAAGGVHLHVVRELYKARDAKQNFIYASNHASEMDGLILQAFFGPDMVPFTAPLASFNYMIGRWMYRMGAIEILRDEIDKKRYPNGHTKREALHLAVKLLADGHSLLIFPEGHIERIEALYRFHTGAARLAYASGVPIQPIILKDAHIVFTNMFAQTSGIVTVAHGKQLIPDPMHGEEILFTELEELREKVRAMTHELEEQVLAHLPLRLVKDQRPVASDIAAFVDIDMTLYRGLSQIDFVIYLVRKNMIPVSHALYVGRLFLFEKLGFIGHDTLMNKSMQMLSGWKSSAVDRLAREFFKNLALPKIQHGLSSLLEDHLAKGHRLVFVSESIHPLAQSFANFFAADGAIDTSLARRGKTYTGDIQYLCRGEAKAEGMKRFAEEHNIDLARSYAYADSWSDLQMLELVGHPTVVRPDKKLKQYAHRKRIPILKHLS